MSKHNNAYRDDFHRTYLAGRIDFHSKKEVQPETTAITISKVNGDIDLCNTPFEDVDKVASMLPAYCWKLTQDEYGYCLVLFSHRLNTPQSSFVRSFVGVSHKQVYMKCLKYLIEEENYKPVADKV